MGGKKKPVSQTKTLGSGWTTLEWTVNHGFTITMHTSGIRMRKTWNGIGYGETTSSTISIHWILTIPYGSIQAKGKAGQEVTYTYS